MDELFGVALEVVLWLLDVFFFSVDGYSWFKGRANRIERRNARKLGLEVPPRDPWNRRVIVFSLVALLLTGILAFIYR